jgi:hypothetical protein
LRNYTPQQAHKVSQDIQNQIANRIDGLEAPLSCVEQATARRSSKECCRQFCWQKDVEPETEEEYMKANCRYEIKW